MDISSELPAIKSQAHTVYIFNMSEDVWPFIQAMNSSAARTREIEENADLGDRDLFSFCGEENMIFVLSEKVGSEFLEYFESLFGK